MKTGVERACGIQIKRYRVIFLKLFQIHTLRKFKEYREANCGAFVMFSYDIKTSLHTAIEIRPRIFEYLRKVFIYMHGEHYPIL